MSRIVGETMQRGMVLITGLIFLVILTLLGLSAFQNTTMEERMAGNLRSEGLAFQAAEAALRRAEQAVRVQVSRPVIGGRVGASSSDPRLRPLDDPETGNTDAAYSSTLPWAQAWDAAAWVGAYTDVYNQSLRFGTETGQVIAPTDVNAPRFVLEERGFDKESLTVGQPPDSAGRIFYQTTARGLDPSSRSEVILRTTYGRRF